MSGWAFASRWLKARGVDHQKAIGLAAAARERTRRYPVPMPWLYAAALFFVEWLAPLIMLHRFKRASGLDDTQIEDLEQRLHKARSINLRLLFVLVRLPLWEQLNPEPRPATKIKHPLAGRLSTPRDNTFFDVLIIGSGAGGAPLAWQLARQGYNVALVESGGLTAPETTAAVLENYYLKQGMLIAKKRGMIPVFAGNTVGGTTSINSGTCLRPTEEQLSAWDRKLGTKFAQGELTSYLQLAEEKMGVSTPPRSLLGPSGPLFEKGLQALGRHGAYVLPRSAPDCQGSGRCCFVCPAGAKLSTDLAFLPEALAAGLELFAPVRATQVYEQADHVAVTVKQQDGVTATLLTKRLVLSAGALGTPQLIRKNHLGPCWRQAGRHFRVHPATKVFASFEEPVCEDHGVPQGMGYRTPELPRVVFEGVFTPKAAAAPLLQATGQRHCWWLTHYAHVASFGFMLRERSEGRLRYCLDWPFMDYALNRDDVHDMAAGALLCAEAFLAAGAERVLLPVVGRQNEYESLDELRSLRPEDFVQENLVLSGFHPQGTAAIGQLVDQHLQLIGSKRIYVCDASVLPLSPGVNPQITIMALSLRLAEHLLRAYN